MLYGHNAGYIFSKGDVPLYIAATLVWSEGRRAHIEVATNETSN